METHTVDRSAAALLASVPRASGPMGGTGRPVLYGTPDEVLVMMEAVDRQPGEVLATAEVRESWRRVATTIERRIGQANPVMSVTADRWDEVARLSNYRSLAPVGDRT